MTLAARWTPVLGVTLANATSLTSLTNWSCGWYAVELHGGDISPSFVGDDLEFAHVGIDHGLNLSGLLIDHWHHDDAGEQSHNADGRSRNAGDIS